MWSSVRVLAPDHLDRCQGVWLYLPISHQVLSQVEQHPFSFGEPHSVSQTSWQWASPMEAEVLCKIGATKQLSRLSRKPLNKAWHAGCPCSAEESQMKSNTTSSGANTCHIPRFAFLEPHVETLSEIAKASA